MESISSCEPVSGRDEIRRTGNRYDHPTWHYINYPLSPPNFPLLDAPDRCDDVLSGIQQSAEVLTKPRTSFVSRAAHLSWLLHLIGDIHQPLHATALFPEEFPDGDRGGNDFYVRPANAGIKLHSYWDGLLGTSGDVRSARNDATRLLNEYERSDFESLAAKGEALSWSLESRGHAIESVYLNGELEPATTQGTAHALPADYASAAKALAEQQVVLAGYRLADYLKTLAEG